ncbi:MAG: hypothetical protein WC492_00250 [Candidatus Micrarchaeia archaeon]
MEGKDDLRALMEKKSKEKKDLISTLRQTNNEIVDIQKELDAKYPKGDSKKSSSPSRIQERIDKLEFFIATSAYTAAQEKDLIRKLDVLKKEFNAATKDSAQWVALKKLRDDLRAKRDSRKQIRKDLDAMSKELDAIYQSIIEQGTKNVEDRKNREARRDDAHFHARKREDERKYKDAQKKEMAPYMKELDSFVSLEDIAEVKKKK